MKTSPLSSLVRPLLPCSVPSGWWEFLLPGSFLACPGLHPCPSSISQMAFFPCARDPRICSKGISLSQSGMLSHSLSLNPYSPKWPGALGNKDQELLSQNFPETQNDTCSNRWRQKGKTRKEGEINVPVTSLPSLSTDYPFPRLLICLYHLNVLISTHQRSFINWTGTEWGCRWLMPKVRGFHMAKFTCHLVCHLCLHPFSHLSHPNFPD